MAGTIECINQVRVQGRIGQDPIFKREPTYCLLKFSVATSKRVKGKGDSSVEKTEWHSILCWGELAETMNREISKGAVVYVEGELQTSTWNDKKHGDKRYKTEIVANLIERVDYRTGTADEPPHPEQSAPQPVAEDDLPF
jgi:single-strand DNA-binding protein